MPPWIRSAGDSKPLLWSGCYDRGGGATLHWTTPQAMPLHFKGHVEHPASQSEPEHLELPVEELLRRARPLPDHDEMVIEGLSEEEGEAFLVAVQS